MPVYELMLLCERTSDNEHRFLKKHGNKANVSMTDKSGQVGEDIQDIPVVLLHVEVPRQNLLNSIVADSEFFVIARRTRNDDGSYTDDDFEAALQAADATAFAAWVDANFSKMKANRRTRIKGLVAAGSKRANVAATATQRLKSGKDLDRDEEVIVFPIDEIIRPKGQGAAAQGATAFTAQAAEEVPAVDEPATGEEQPKKARKKANS